MVRVKARSSSLLSTVSDNNGGGQRRKKTSIYDEYQKEFKSVRSRKTARKSVRNPNYDARITINIRGHKYETYLDTLNRFPNTLLGNKKSRDQYYDSRNDEITLYGNLQTFEAVLFYYQSDGILARPIWVSEMEFQQELSFYQLKQSKIQQQTNSRKNRENEKNTEPKNANKVSVFRETIWNLMERPDSSFPARVCALFSILTILVSIVTFCLETLPELVDLEDKIEEARNKNILFCFETVVITWFTMEYIFRVISAPRRLEFLRSFMGVIDVVVILPYYINLLLNEEIKTVNFAIFRTLRMFRVFRVFKLTRYSTGMKVLGKTIIESLGQLVALFLCLFLSAIIFASCLYYMELDENNTDTFSSIPDSFWYVVITMSSVGYGDVIPSTYIGRVTAALCMICGIVVLFCLPTPVFITHFGRFYDEIISKPSINYNNTEQQIADLAADDSEVWKNEAENLFVPKWVTDNGWKERMRTDVKQQLLMPGINIYASATNLALSRAYSREMLNTEQYR